MFRITCAINDDYIPYLYACLNSLLAHIKKSDKYHFYVMFTDISESNIKNILALQNKNLKISFLNLNPLFDTETRRDFVVNSNFTPETYYRFFLPQIFPRFDKILYLDADTIVLHDISPLFRLDIKKYYMAATHDYEIIRTFKEPGNLDKDYFENILKINPDKYFQAGVMLINLNKMRQDNITNKLIACLKQIKTPKYVDQDILNVVCQNNVKYIDIKWDYMWHLPITDLEYDKHLPEKYVKKYLNTGNNPYIVHFTGIKPTEYKKTKHSMNFHKYLKDGPYEKWIMDMFAKNNKKQIKLIRTYRAKIIKYRLLNFLTLGLFKIKYNRKIQNRKNDLQKVYTYCIN